MTLATFIYWTILLGTYYIFAIGIYIILRLTGITKLFPQPVQAVLHDLFF